MGKITTEKFEQLIDELEEKSLNTLKEKNRKYTAKSGDALHNFRTGASVDGTTMPQTIWHYWKKHFISLLDKIKEDNWEDKEDALEKIQDSINYLRFIWCAINDNETIINTYRIDMGDNQKEIIIPLEEKYDNNCNDYISCNDCIYCHLSDDNNNWDKSMEKMIIEPCKSCKANFSILEEEYKTAPNNFSPKKYK